MGGEIEQRKSSGLIFVVTSTQRRGAEVFSQNVVTELRAREWEVDFTALHQSDSAASIDADPLVRLEEGIDIGGLNFGVVRRLREHIRRLAPSLVVAGGGATLKYTIAATVGLLRAPAIVYTSIGEPDYWARSTLKRLGLGILLRRATMITAVSEATAAQLTAGFGVADEKVRVAYPGVPMEFLDVGRSSHEGPLRVLFMGSLSNEKDPLSAVRCVEGVGAGAVLRFVGSGPLAGEVEAEAIARGVDVEMVGAVDDVRPHLEWADVLILTSRTEGLPGVILEAGAAGVPAVAYAVGGVAEAVADGVTGFVIDPGDIDASAAAMERLAGDRGLVDRMAAAARDRVRETFLMSHAVDRYVSVLEQAL